MDSVKMAPEAKPPDKPEAQFYTCCQRKKNVTVICVICEDAYHYTDFIKLEDVKFIGNNLVICPKHQDLTSKVEEGKLPKSAKVLIAQIKLMQREEIKRELLAELNNKTQDLHNTTLLDSDAEFELLKTENALLKTLNKEIQEKNELLKELLTKNKEINVHKGSYASAVINNKIKKQERVPNIIIKSTNKNDKDKNINLKKCVAQFLTQDKSIQTKNIYAKNNTEMIVNCVDGCSVERAEKMLKDKLKDNCEVKIEALNLPKIKIVGIDNSTGMDLQKIENDINTRNFSHTNSKGKVVHMFTGKNKQFTNILMEVPSDIYKYIRENNNRVFVGYQSCRVYDEISIRPCSNCARFLHSNTKCRNSVTCLKCSEPHKTEECKAKLVKCANCSFSNLNYKTNYNTNHCAFDAMNCDILKSKIKKYISAIDYPIQPDLSTRSAVVTERQTRTADRKKTTTITATTNTKIPMEKSTTMQHCDG